MGRGFDPRPGHHFPSGQYQSADLHGQKATPERPNVVMSAARCALFVTAACWTLAAVTLHGQQSGADQISAAALDRIRVALSSTPSGTTDSFRVDTGPTPDRFRLGALTFVPPDTPGQFVAVRVPVGDFATRAIHSVEAAHRRRTERAARTEVERVVAALQPVGSR